MLYGYLTKRITAIHIFVIIKLCKIIICNDDNRSMEFLLLLLVLISQSVSSQQVIHWHTRFEVISSHQYQIGCRIQLRNKSSTSGFEPMTFAMVSCTHYHLAIVPVET